MDLLDRAAVTYQLVLTKADSTKPAALARKQAEIAALAAKHPAAYPRSSPPAAKPPKASKNSAPNWPP